ncbi:MAG: leucine--tRNA ligase [Proteobacteria bacterium]|nr:leucine--tRNA ligase [Pseudomonadota bacterium]
MNSEYNAQEIETQAQKYWMDNKSFEVVEDPTKEKYYCLSMFPYPSGRLHMGHVRNYSIGDVISRFQKMQGKNVLQPIGWDAFGLPAENAALKNKVPPAKWTYENIDYMRLQLSQLGFGYDWSREIATCHPKYYKWEQWLFIKLFEKGLVYKKNAVVNWDPVDQTVLANEQVIDGRGWRSDALIEKKEISQWFMRITDYADELLDSLDNLTGWPDAVKTMQRNWIGKSTGLEISFNRPNADALKVYTTRPDTLMGVTYLAVASEHPLSLEASKKNPDVQKFIDQCRTMETSEAAMETMEKRGIDSGLTCKHPLTGNEVPIWIANFVLMGYGTGAVMSVPAHDQRDYEFAKKYNIPMLKVIKPQEGEHDIDQSAYTEKGVLCNSNEFNGLDSSQAFEAIASLLESKNLGKKQNNYRLRDWGVSRQRYWGCPIPIINCSSCGSVAVPEQDLPIALPEEVVFDGVGSPIKKMPEFYETTCPQCGAQAERETDTFDTFFESSWYFARYACADSDKAMLDDRANYWLEVDQYVGGIEHAILHLLYARFFNKLLRDEGLISHDEPFKNLLTQGMVLKDGAKMSKSKGNTVDPAEMIEKYGADTVRLFILFAAPPTQDLEWSDTGLEGAYRFVNKVYRLVETYLSDAKNHQTTTLNTDSLNAQQKEMRQKTHQTLSKITDDIERRHSFNTAIAALMELTNALNKFNGVDGQSLAVRLESITIILRTLSPITPHVCHYLWQQLGYNTAIINESWPQVESGALEQDEVQIIVQVNGKLRAKITLPANSDKQFIETSALTDTNVAKFTQDLNILKVIVIPNKLVNIVAK